MGQDAIHKLQERYADKYSHMTMVEGKREDSLVLDKYAEGQEIQQMNGSSSAGSRENTNRPNPRKRRTEIGNDKR